jgi:S-formylglutathione hydrolase FrmB
MFRHVRIIALGCALLCAAIGQASPIFVRSELDRTNRHLHGRVIDFTHNHGADRRIWSDALQQKRDLYVYVPPCFDPSKCYPVMLWLHGFAQTEVSFLQQVVGPLDQAIYEGRLPPIIVAAPDGTVDGKNHRIITFNSGSFYINSKAGRFEDYIVQDVWCFLLTNFPILPQRECHVIAGASMGGGGAYNLAFKHRDQFGIVVGIYPPVNTRWVDCHGRYRSKFDPCCWGWRTDFRRREVVARFVGIPIRLKLMLDPIFDPHNHDQTIEDIARENPLEMLYRLDIREGDLSMYIGYGGRDQFYMDAQVESFLYGCREKGINVDVGYVPRGKHDLRTAYKLLPGLLEWLRPQLPDVR